MVTTNDQQRTGPQVWLAGVDKVTLSSAVRDNQYRVWLRGPNGLYCTADDNHRVSAAELHELSDLVEVFA